VTGNDFSTLYAPLIRDGRMEKFYWAPTREDRIGVCKGIFRLDNVRDEDVTNLVDMFPGQSIGITQPHSSCSFSIFFLAPLESRSILWNAAFAFSTMY
jgi:hypothetical protein